MQVVCLYKSSQISRPLNDSCGKSCDEIGNIKIKYTEIQITSAFLNGLYWNRYFVIITFSKEVTSIHVS